MPTPLKAIKAYCFGCCGESHKEVTDCPHTTCELYAYRKGKNTNIKRKLTKEQRDKIAKQLHEGREKKDG